MIVAQAREVDYDKAVMTAKGKAPTRPVVHLSSHNLRKIFDNYQIIGDVKTDDRRFIRVAVGTLDGYRYVTLREFYYHARDEVFKPGKYGIRIPMASPFYEDHSGPTIRSVGPELLEHLIRAFDTAQTMDLADPNNALYIGQHYSRKDAVKMKEIGNNENL